MNTNLFTIIKQIVSMQGEDILTNPQRLKAFFSDLAKNEPKPERIAFGRCIENGYVQILKNTAETERDKCKQQLAQRLHNDEGFDLTLCEDTLDLLSAVLFGSLQKNYYCKICGKELQIGWKTCPYCANTSQNTSTLSLGSGNIEPPAIQQSYTPVIVQKKKTPVKNFFIFLLIAALLGFIGYYVVTNIIKPSIITDVKIETKYSYASDNEAFFGILTDIIGIKPDIYKYLSLFELIGFFRHAMFEEDQEIEKWLKFKYGMELKAGEAIKIVYIYKGEKDGFDFIYKPYNKDVFSQSLVSVYEFVTLLENIEMDN